MLGRGRNRIYNLISLTFVVASVAVVMFVVMRLVAG